MEQINYVENELLKANDIPYDLVQVTQLLYTIK